MSTQISGRHARPSSPRRLRLPASPRRILIATLAVLAATAATIVPASATGGGEHPSIDVTVTHPSECGVDDGKINVERDGRGKHGHIYRYDVEPGQDNGFSELGTPETGLAPGDYDVFLLEREFGEGPDDWEEVEGTRETVTVSSNCVTVEASGDCETVAVTYTNATNHPYFGDIRVDGEAGEADAHSTTEKSQGPLPLTAFGLRYQNVDLPANSTTTHEVNFEGGSGEHTVAYRVARGPEQLYYSIGWNDVTVDCGEPEAPQNGEDGTDGQDGQDGEDGTDGQDGEDGTDGEDGETVIIKTPTRINTGR